MNRLLKQYSQTGPILLQAIFDLSYSVCDQEVAKDKNRASERKRDKIQRSNDAKFHTRLVR